MMFDFLQLTIMFFFGVETLIYIFRFHSFLIMKLFVLNYLEIDNVGFSCLTGDV